jgi:enoyl-CoA hydratase/carnithine racemase
MSCTYIKTEIVDGVMKLSLNRPEKKNAITLAMYDALSDSIESAEQDDDVRVIFIRGVGGCFCAGNDMADFVSPPPESETSPAPRFIRNIATAQKPLIAAVDGLAVGIGTTMLLHCDLVYAASSTRFSMPFVNLGLTPEAASSYLLPKLVGHQRASELLLLGESFSAETACKIGMVNQLFSEETLHDQALEKALELAAKPLEAVLATKSLLKKGSQKITNEIIAEELEIFANQMRSPEFATIVTAFLTSRKA